MRTGYPRAASAGDNSRTWIISVKGGKLVFGDWAGVTRAGSTGASLPPFSKAGAGISQGPAARRTPRQRPSLGLAGLEAAVRRARPLLSMLLLPNILKCVDGQTAVSSH